MVEGGTGSTIHVEQRGRCSSAAAWKQLQVPLMGRLKNSLRKAEAFKKNLHHSSRCVY